MTQIITRRRAAAGAATGALVASALMFAPTAQAATPTDVRESQIAKFGGSTAGWYQALAAGTNQITTDGLQLNAGSRVLQGNVATSVDLDDLAKAAVKGTGTFVAVVTDDNFDGGSAHVTPAADSKWQADKAITGGSSPIAADTPLSPTDLKTALAPGTAPKVTAFGVESTSDTKAVTSFDFDDSTYQFKNNAPTAVNGSASTKVNTAVTVALSGSDIDGNELTYKVDSVVGGSATVAGSTLTFAPAKNFKGSGSVKYTITDGRGDSATATVTIKVDKSKGRVEIYRIHPTRPSVRSTVYVYALIQVDGQKATPGTTIYVYAKGKKVSTAKVNSTGKVKLKLPNKLPAGNATLKVSQVGSSVLNGDSDSIKVKIRK